MYVFRSHIWKVGMTVFAEKSKYAVKSDLLIWWKTEIFNEVFKYVNIEKYCKSSLDQENHHVKSPTLQHSASDWRSKFGTLLDYETKCQHWLSNRKDSSFFDWNKFVKCKHWKSSLFPCSRKSPCQVTNPLTLCIRSAK